MLRQLQQQQQLIAQQSVQLQWQDYWLGEARAEAAAEAAELRGRMQDAEGRVQALEGQLQEVLAALRRQTLA
jgi:hypothetical protein